MKNQKDTTLVLLRILMRKTSKLKPLTKKEIMDCLADEDIYIEEKQFYRCIDKIIEAGYPVCKIKGKYAKYYCKVNNMDESTFSLVTNLIKTSNNFSAKDKQKLLEACYISLYGDYVVDVLRYSDEFDVTESDEKKHIIRNYKNLYKSFKKKIEVSYKIFTKNNISHEMTGIVTSINELSSPIKVTINNETYELNQLGNVRLIENI